MFPDGTIAFVVNEKEYSDNILDVEGKEGKMSKIAVGCDHAGFELKSTVLDTLKNLGYDYMEFGCMEGEPVDYPQVAHALAQAVVSGECERGILICGTGIGISMAANKVKGIRAAACSDCYSAKLTREHNDANVLTFGARVVGPGLAQMLVETFLSTEFSNGERHVRRVSEIEEGCYDN